MNPTSDLRPVVVIVGPTAVGKSALAARLTSDFNMHVINADARQIFRTMNVGTAKPTREELDLAPSFGYDILDPTESTSAADYAARVRAYIASMPSTALPVLVGGSGLYVSAIIDGFSSAPQPTDDIRRLVQDLLLEKGRTGLWEELYRRDPIAAERYADKNPRRVARALEHIFSTDTLFSTTWQEARNTAPFAPYMIGLHRQRDIERNVIEQRCRDMWAGGLRDEARHLLTIPASEQALATVGYAEALRWMRGEITEEQALTEFIRNSQRYAKRQMTWFRRDGRIHWYEADTNKTFEMIVNDLLDQSDVRRFAVQHEGS